MIDFQELGFISKVAGMLPTGMSTPSSLVPAMRGGLASKAHGAAMGATQSILKNVGGKMVSGPGAGLGKRMLMGG